MHALLLTLLLAITPATQPATTHLRVVDESGKPLPRATIEVTILGQTETLFADENGRADVEITNAGQVTVMAPGHVPGRKHWALDAKHPEWNPPAEFEFRLPAGTKIGGVVQDEQGKAIANAKVRIFLKEAPPNLQFKPDRATYAAWDIPTKTDSRGHWQCDMAPASWEVAYIQPSHPDFFSAPYLTPLKDDALRSGTAIATMKSGRSIVGRVLDPSGNPLAGAKVRVGNSININDESPLAMTDGHGEFHIAHADTVALQILVSAKGFAPFIEWLPKGEVTGFVVNVANPRTVRGSVVDESGQPVADATVLFHGWGKCSADTSDLRRQSDADGHFEFGVPPDVAVDLAASSQNSGSSPEITVPADASDVRIVLLKPAQVTGAAIDSETRQPIKSFKVLGATSDDNYASYWGWANADGSNGQYTLAFDTLFKTYRVRIEADGHLPASSDILVPADGKYAFNAELKPAKNLAGVVFGTDGKPLAGAHVLLVLASDPGLDLEDALEHPERMTAVTCDANGAFTLWPLDEPFQLAVVDESGSAQVGGDDFAHSNQLHLISWARIEGNVKGSANVKLSLDDHQSVLTEATGHFVFTHVKPGKHAVMRTVSSSDDQYAGEQVRTIATESGKTSTLDFDRSSHRIVATILSPGDLPKDAMFRVSNLTRIDDANALANHEAWNREKYWTGGSSLNYQFSIHPDGAIVIPNVDPGKYQLTIESAIASPGGFCGEGELIASCSKEVTVAPDSSDSIDLGKIKLDPAPRIAVNQDAPNFTVPTLDGKSIHLSDLRGKYVLLDFWATWCGPCKAEEPFLHAAFDKFQGDDRFVIISLSADEKRDTLKKYLANHEMPWTQGWLGKFDDSPVLKSYYVRGIPSIWLIGPDGKVLAKNLRETGIDKIVSRALAK